MPSRIRKRGLWRYRGSVTVKGVTMQKLFSDDTRKSYRTAVAWEDENRRVLEKEISKTNTNCWTLLEWAEKYLDFVQDRFNRKTYHAKKAAFGRLVRAVEPETDVEGITVSHALAFLSKQTKSRSGCAINKDRKNLSAAWEWGRKYLSGWPDGQNPFRAVDKLPEERTPRYVPAEEDFWSVYNLAQEEDRRMLLAFLHLAARRSEIFGLTWTDVDFGNGRVRLWTRKRNGGHREPDWLPMTTELREALRGVWEKRSIASPYVFICKDRSQLALPHYGKPFTSRIHFMRKLCNKAGVKYFSYHAIRHLTATILYRGGYSVAHIQRVLRHRNPNTTAGYLHALGLGEVREVLEKGLKRPAQIIHFKQKTPGLVNSEG